jgi:hypothetical protein
MRQLFLFIFAFSLVYTPVVLAQGAPGSNGVWTSSGHSVESLSGGSNSKVGILGSGPAQAKNNSPAPTVDSVDVVYDKAERVEMLQISGTNLSPYKEKVRVTVDGSQASVISSKPTMIMAMLPSGIGDNKALISIEINGQTVLKDRKIKLPPKVEGVSLMSGPPGTPITITGSRFGNKASEATVTIGGSEAPVLSCSRTSITTVIPMGFNAQSPSWGVPITVKVNGISSNDDVSVRVQSRMY